MMRVITGKARGVRLQAPAGETTRPTSERAKEAIFSMLQFDLFHAAVLDLFAGSGQMGIEALSRGAAHAVFCDTSKASVAAVQSNLQKTRLEALGEVYSMDFLALLRSFENRKCFDLVFLDPPYSLGAIPKALRALLSCHLLNDGARIICESASFEDVFSEDEALASGFEILKTVHYGVAYITVLRFSGKGEVQ